MATTYHNDLQQLYVAYFNRPADPGGLAFYEGVLERAAAAGGADAVASAKAMISADFAKSTEYQTTYNQVTTAGVVTAVYENLFGHAPDAEGLAFYVKALNDKAMTVDTMVTFIANGAQGSDKVAFESKVQVATAFTNALNTEAEIEGYNKAGAQAAAKTLLAGIETAAQATAAVVPATLDASVANVIKAGVPFTLQTGLAALDASNKAVADFLAGVEIDLDGDDEIDENVEVGDITANLELADEAVEALVSTPEIYEGAKPAVKAAIAAQELADLADTLETNQENLTKAVTAMNAKAGLGNAVATATSAAEVAEEADVARVEAQNDFDGALAVLQRDELIRVNENGTVDLMKEVPGATEADPVTYVVDKALVVLKDGELVVPTGVKAADYNGLANYVTAANALPVANAEAMDAADAALLAQARVEVIDLSAASLLTDLGAKFKANGPVDPAASNNAPTADEIAAQLNGLKLLAIDAREKAAAAPDDVALQEAAVAAEGDVTTFRTAVETFVNTNTTTLATDVVNAEKAVEEAQEAYDDLAEAVAALEEAQALSDELTSLQEAVTAAKAEFKTNKFAEPADLKLTSNFGTSGNDIFVTKAGVNTATITSFGLQGDDVLYIGSGYTLNDGKLAEGDNAVLEVFFTQKGSSTVVTIETKAYGSETGTDVQTITLTGVDAEDLTFNNGIISI